MEKFSVQKKIILVAAIWLVLGAAGFFYFFPLLDESNALALEQTAAHRKELAELKAERQNEIKSEADLKELSQKDLQPEDFFSKDITVVDELRILESLGKLSNVELQFSGVSGTVKTAPAAGTVTQLAVIPYSITLNGEFFQVVDLIETLENLSFITNLSGLTISAANEGTVTGSMSANFYLRK